MFIPEIILFKLEQGNDPLEEYTEAFLEVTSETSLPDDFLCNWYIQRLNSCALRKLSGNPPRGNLMTIVEWVLASNGSPLTVDYASTTPDPEHLSLGADCRVKYNAVPTADREPHPTTPTKPAPGATEPERFVDCCHLERSDQVREPAKIQLRRSAYGRLMGHLQETPLISARKAGALTAGTSAMEDGRTLGAEEASLTILMALLCIWAVYTNEEVVPKLVNADCIQEFPPTRPLMSPLPSASPVSPPPSPATAVEAPQSWPPSTSSWSEGLHTAARACDPKFPPRPFDPTAPPWLLAPSSPPWPVSPSPSLGSFVPPAPPWSVVVPPTPPYSAFPATPHRAVLPAPLGSSFPSTSPQSSVAPAPSRSSRSTPPHRSPEPPVSLRPSGASAPTVLYGSLSPLVDPLPLVSPRS
ncbi:hypothetical protein M9458_040856, partial [Cirrhinus mrigala]